MLSLCCQREETSEHLKKSACNKIGSTTKWRWQFIFDSMWRISRTVNSSSYTINYFIYIHSRTYYTQNCAIGFQWFPTECLEELLQLATLLFSVWQDPSSLVECVVEIALALHICKCQSQWRPFVGVLYVLQRHVCVWTFWCALSEAVLIWYMIFHFHLVKVSWKIILDIILHMGGITRRFSPVFGN